jgi:hypothetical protein
MNVPVVRAESEMYCESQGKSNDEDPPVRAHEDSARTDSREIVTLRVSAFAIFANPPVSRIRPGVIGGQLLGIQPDPFRLYHPEGVETRLFFVLRS